MFAETARCLGQAARSHGLSVPTFRSPPKVTELRRSIKWDNDSSIVSVLLKGRPQNAVISDMIEGILVANHLDNKKSDSIRAFLWVSVEGQALAA